MGCASSAPLAPGGQTGVANDAPPYDLKPNEESTLTTKLRQNAQDIVESSHIQQVIGNNVNSIKNDATKAMNGKRCINFGFLCIYD